MSGARGADFGVCPAEFQSFGLEGGTECVRDGAARLLNTGGGEGGRADDIACHVDVRDAGSIMGVHGDEAAVSGSDSGGC